MDSEDVFRKYDNSCVVDDVRREGDSSEETSLVIFDVTEATWFSSCDCVPIEDLLSFCEFCDGKCDTPEVIELPNSDSARAGEKITKSISLTSPPGSVSAMEIKSDRFYLADRIEDKFGPTNTEENTINDLNEDLKTPFSSNFVIFKDDRKTTQKTSELFKKEELDSELKTGTDKVSVDNIGNSVNVRDLVDEDLQLPQPMKRSGSLASEERFPNSKQGPKIEQCESNVFARLSKDITNFDHSHKRDKFVPLSAASRCDPSSCLQTESVKKKMDFESRVDSLTAKLPKRRMVWPVCSKYPNCSICTMEVEEVGEDVSRFLMGFEKVIVPSSPETLKLKYLSCHLQPLNSKKTIHFETFKMFQSQ